MTFIRVSFQHTGSALLHACEVGKEQLGGMAAREWHIYRTTQWTDKDVLLAKLLVIGFYSFLVAALHLLCTKWAHFFASLLIRSKTSAVDGRPLDGVPSVRVLQDTKFELDGRAITCTEVNRTFNEQVISSRASEPCDGRLNVWLPLQVFYQLKTADCSLSSVLSSCSVFQKEIALSACSALSPHLAVLTTCGINSLSLRISTQADMVWNNT